MLSMWIKENKKIHMTVMPGRSVNIDEEFLISYGNEHWYQEKFPFHLLQKAIWRYRSEIDLSLDGCWPHHKMAHALFNTPYNGQLPFVFHKCPCARCIIGTTENRQLTAIHSKREYVQPLQSQSMHPPLQW